MISRRGLLTTMFGLPAVALARPEPAKATVNLICDEAVMRRIVNDAVRGLLQQIDRGGLMRFTSRHVSRVSSVDRAYIDAHVRRR